VEQLARIVEAQRVVDSPVISRTRRHHLIEKEGYASGGSLDRRETRVKHLTGAGQAQLFSQLVRRRDCLHDDAELMARRSAERLYGTKDAAAAIDV
jgi:hypothetical protein